MNSLIEDKFAELKKAHAEGKEIEVFFCPENKWVPCPNPIWLKGMEYRIKPELASEEWYPEMNNYYQCSYDDGLSWSEIRISSEPVAVKKASGHKYRRPPADPVKPSTTPTTIEGWLHTLPDGYRERALKNGICDLECEVATLASALLAIPWVVTPEGTDFWHNVHKHVMDRRNLLPKLFPEKEPLVVTQPTKTMPALTESDVPEYAPKKCPDCGAAQGRGHDPRNYAIDYDCGKYLKRDSKSNPFHETSPCTRKPQNEPEHMSSLSDYFYNQLPKARIQPEQTKTMQQNTSAASTLAQPCPGTKWAVADKEGKDGIIEIIASSEQCVTVKRPKAKQIKVYALTDWNSTYKNYIPSKKDAGVLCGTTSPGFLSRLASAFTFSRLIRWVISRSLWATGGYVFLPAITHKAIAVAPHIVEWITSLKS